MEQFHFKVYTKYGEKVLEIILKKWLKFLSRPTTCTTELSYVVGQDDELFRPLEHPQSSRSFIIIKIWDSKQFKARLNFAYCVNQHSAVCLCSHDKVIVMIFTCLTKIVKYLVVITTKKIKSIGENTSTIRNHLVSIILSLSESNNSSVKYLVK